MGVIISMQNELTGGTEVDSPFDDTIRDLNQAALEGMAFVGMERPNGKRVAFFLPNINKVDETDEEYIT